MAHPRRWPRWPRPTPSRTSQVVAAARATLIRPHSPDGDPDAQARLCAGLPPPARPGLRAHVAARTRFFDDQVLAALHRGVRQVVILGAGYDDRALRFRTPGARFFELDQPATQADKKRRLARLDLDTTGLTLVPADFRYDKPGTVLDQAGHSTERPTLFLCEGLLVYLDQDTIVELLRALRARAGDGSTLVASLAVHPDGADSAAVVARANAARRTAGAEPWRTILPVTEHLRLFERAGWTATDTQPATGVNGTPDRTLLVTASPII